MPRQPIEPMTWRELQEWVNDEARNYNELRACSGGLKLGTNGTKVSFRTRINDYIERDHNKDALAFWTPLRETEANEPIALSAPRADNNDLAETPEEDTMGDRQQPDYRDILEDIDARYVRREVYETRNNEVSEQISGLVTSTQNLRSVVDTHQADLERIGGMAEDAYTLNRDTARQLNDLVTAHGETRDMAVEARSSANAANNGVQVLNKHVDTGKQVGKTALPVGIGVMTLTIAAFVLLAIFDVGWSGGTVWWVVFGTIFAVSLGIVAFAIAAYVKYAQMNRGKNDNGKVEIRRRTV